MRGASPRSEPALRTSDASLRDASQRPKRADRPNASRPSASASFRRPSAHSQPSRATPSPSNSVSDADALSKVKRHIRRLERRIKRRSDRLRRRQHLDFANKANSFNNDETSKRFFRVLAATSGHSDIIFKHNGARLIHDWPIVFELERFFHELYGLRPPINGMSDFERDSAVWRILDRSFQNDDMPESRDYTVFDLRRVLKRVKTSKACGLDLIGYELIRLLCKDPDIEMVILCLINIITTLGCYPSKMHLSKLILLKKKPVIESFGKLRGINIIDNLKNIVDLLRADRISDIVRRKFHPNQGAYRARSGCEVVLMATHIAINQLAASNDCVYIDIKDLDKCFDRVHRDMIIIKYDAAGVSGKHIRALWDELNHSKVHIHFNGKCGQCQHVRNGLPQGFSEAGDCYNLYTAECITACNECAPILIHGFNMAKVQYSDDGISLSVGHPTAQKLIDKELDTLTIVNLRLNAIKSAMARYARTLKARAEMNTEQPFLLDGVPIPFKQVFEFLGFKHNCGKLDFCRYHFDEKISVFGGLSHVLANQQILGADLSLNAQRSYFCGKIRAAATYGVKIIAFTAKMWSDLDTLQNKYLRRMLSANITTNCATMRVVLGIEPLSIFIAKLKLLFYHAALRTPSNKWHRVIGANYAEYYKLYVGNNHRQKGVQGQFRFPTRDFITTLRFIGLDSRYADINHIPFSIAEWRTLIAKRVAARYRSDLTDFQLKDGWLLDQLTKHHSATDSLSKPYQGMLYKLASLLDVDDPTSNDLKPLTAILFDSTCLDWHMHGDDLDAQQPHACPGRALRAAQRIRRSINCRFCDNHRNAYNLHLLYDCPHFKAQRPAFMKSVETLRTPQTRAEWRTFASHIQKHIAKRRAR